MYIHTYYVFIYIYTHVLGTQWAINIHAAMDAGTPTSFYIRQPNSLSNSRRWILVGLSMLGPSPFRLTPRAALGKAKDLTLSLDCFAEKGFDLLIMICL